jgi:regulator of sigma E protease
MTSLLITILSFLFTVGVLVVIHEFGHYLAARSMDVKILRFSVGFGKALWTKRLGRDRTEWTLAAIPLGGYVKMLDEREGEVAPADAPRAFNRKSVAARIFIVLAGPAANFLLAILLYWVLFVAGTPGIKPVMTEPAPNSAAAVAGFAEGDIIRAVAGEPVNTWNDARWELLKEAMKRRGVAIEVENARGGRSTRQLELAGLSKEDLDRDFLATLGLRPLRPRVSATVGRVVAGSAAEKAGIAAGDLIVSVDGKPVPTWFDFTAIVSASPGKPLAFQVERQGRSLELRATPDPLGEGSARIGRLGVEAPAQEMKAAYERLGTQLNTIVRYGPVDALGRALSKVADLSTFSLKMLGRMVIGDVSWKNISGPITIADYAGQSAQLGWVTFLGFLALVSVSLGVLNLLPIPLLDGGHLVYYFAELVKGSPVSERTMEIGQRFGLALLLGLTLLAFYNDINRQFTG